MLDLTNWQPMRDLILVRRLQPEDRTKSGILFGSPDSLGDSTKGVVLAIGPKVTDVRVGEVVVFGPWSDLLTRDDEVAFVPENECRWTEKLKREIAAIRSQTSQAMKAVARG